MQRRGRAELATASIADVAGRLTGRRRGKKKKEKDADAVATPAMLSFGQGRVAHFLRLALALVAVWAAVQLVRLGRDVVGRRQR